MILNDKELFSLIKGAKRYEKRDGYLTFYRFENEYMEKLSNERPFFKDVVIRNTSIRFDFYTTATSFSFDYKIPFVEQGTLDLLVDGLLEDQKVVKELKRQGHISYNLKEGKKRITLFFSTNAEMMINNFEIDNYELKNDYKAKILFNGDSITAGAGAEHCYKTYVNRLIMDLNIDVFNQSLGGFWFDPHHIEKCDYFDPDLIVLGYGTNMLGWADSMDYISKSFDIYKNYYPNKKFLIITPIWRDTNGNDLEQIDVVKKQIIECSKKLDAYIVDGLTLVPHDPKYFIPDKLHPNNLGAGEYAAKITPFIKKLLDF